MNSQNLTRKALISTTHIKYFHPEFSSHAQIHKFREEDREYHETEVNFGGSAALADDFIDRMFYDHQIDSERRDRAAHFISLHDPKYEIKPYLGDVVTEDVYYVEESAARLHTPHLF